MSSLFNNDKSITLPDLATKVGEYNNVLRVAIDLVSCASPAPESDKSYETSNNSQHSLGM